MGLEGSKGGAFQYSRRGLRLQRRGAYGIHRASGPRCQGLCRKVASLRSGGRRFAVRTAKEHPIGALPRTPFPASRDFPSRGNEKIGGTGCCVTYDTESKSRNVSCVPFRGRGPRSGEGVDGGKNDYDILILCLIALKGKRLTTFCASLRSGGRRLAVRTAKEHPIGALPCTPFASSRRSPQGETRSMGRKNRESYTSVTISAFSPFGGWRHHLARWEACHWIRGSRGSPMNPVPLPPPQFGGTAKGKRLNGQARRLTSPHLEVLCRTSTVAL